MNAAAFLVLGLPLAVFASLALLPPGRPAFWGIAVAAGLALAFRLVFGDPVLSALAGAGIALAGIAQLLRALLGARLPHNMYLALLPALALIALVAFQALTGA